MDLLSFSEKKSKGFWLLITFLVIAILGILDYLTGRELVFSPFYLIPVASASWFVGRRSGLFFAFLSTLMWFTINNFSGRTYSTPIYFYLNFLLRLMNYIVIVALVARLKDELLLQNHLAHTDATTGLANPRAFMEFLEHETARVSRYPTSISVMYLDLDNFKKVNDHYGHKEGDRALSCVAQTLQHSLRKTDFVARIGGDEFAVVLTETGVDDALLVSKKVRAYLCAEMEKEGWPITFSIGIVSASKGSNPIPPDEILHQADDLMYIVKKNGKNNIQYAAYQERL